MTPILQVEELIDGQRFGRFNINLLCWSFLAMFADGFDISALASAMPQLSETWHVAAKSFAPALSASLFGILLGAPLLGYVGDSFGRKAAIIIGCGIFGATTLLTVRATDLHQVMALRWLAGIGIGGLMPNTIALNSELAPKRLREALIVLMFMGTTTGAGVPGFVQAWLIPRYGWQIMFWIGGLVPLLIAVCLPFTLPESVKYLASQPRMRVRLLANLRRLRRDLVIADDALFAIAPAPQAAGSGLAQIFGPRLKWVTLILWVCFMTTLMANYAMISWLPTIFVSNGLTARQSGIAVSCYSYGGTLGGIAMSVLLGRLGFTVVAALALIAAPAVATIGLPGITFTTLLAATTLSGVGILGAQFGNNATAGLIYPTAFRSRGVGWALAVGRFGAIIGPLVGGVLIGMQLPPQRLFALAAVPSVISLIASVALAVLCYRRLSSLRLGNMAETAMPLDVARTPEIPVPADLGK